MVKNLKPRFAPRKERKAYYADINFDLLGKLIENVSSFKLSEAYKKYIFDPLELSHTYLPENENDLIPQIYYMNQIIYRPKLVISCGASGGCITNAHELMIFIKAFFGGKLFNKNIFNSLSTYNKLQISMGPIYYGGGYMQIPLNGVISLFKYRSTRSTLIPFVDLNFGELKNKSVIKEIIIGPKCCVDEEEIKFIFSNYGYSTPIIKNSMSTYC
ncbi:serine hydrolase [Sedimentibacter hydroxybenzoicus]|uniref:serine hydrolase n=1 Tax=Sedimentibacter hydroxybenzoicus TaxID=29345 RepID=UPI0024834DDE|nr:serine hydrolase domain-containing protein [Sedimentibacter hydroxybenzoicus]